MKKSYIYAVITVLIWSTNAPLVKKLLFDIPNLEALSIGSYLAFLFLIIINFKNGSLKLLKNYSFKDYGVMSALGFIGLFLYSALYYYGLSQLTSQEACIINYLWPIMLVLFSCIILKERFTILKLAAIVCSFIGIIILSSGTESIASGNTLFGILSCIIAAACYGLFSVLNKKASYPQGISMMIFWLVTAVCSMILGLLTETWVPIKTAQWPGMLWLGIVISAVAYLTWALAINESKNTAAIANLAYLTPFLSLIFSAVLLGEQIQLRAFIALLFIIGGILLQSIFDNR